MSNNLMKSSGFTKPQSSSRLVKPSASGRRSFSSVPADDSVSQLTAVDKNQVDELAEFQVSGSSSSSRKSSHQKREPEGSVTAAEAAAYEQARRLSEAGIRRLSDTSIVLTGNTDTFMVGEKVYVNGVKAGHIQYIGDTQFAPGEWAGIVLEDFSGKNDGSVGGVRYFQCQPKRGIFSRLTRLTRQPLEPDSLAAIMASQTLSEGSAGDETQRSSSPSVRSLKSSSPAPQGSTVSVQAIGDLRLGDRVTVTSSQGCKAGTLRYLGTTDFASGQWAGVELDEAIGKNNGYFKCPAMYGLFAPVSKVSRGGANRKTSVNSMTNSTTASKESSVVHTTSTIVTTSRLSPSPLTSKIRSSTNTDPARKEIQDLLTEKDYHIQQLLQEREMDRAEVIRAAAQSKAAEKKLSQVQQQLELQQAATESVRSNLLAQIDDLQFRVEEQNIQQAELKNKCANLLSSNRDLEKQLLDERRRTEQLENEAQGGFEAEEVALKYKEEVEALRNELNVVNSLKKKLQESADLKDQEIRLKTQEIVKLKNNTSRSAGVDVSSTQIKSAQTQCALLIQQVEDLTLKCSKMEETLSQEKKEHDKLNRQLEHRNQEFVERVGDLQRKFETSEERHAQLAREKAELQAQLHELHQSKNVETSLVVELNQQLRSALDDLNKERKKTKDLSCVEAEYEGELQVLRKRTFESDEQVKNLEAELMYSEEENETLRKKVSQLEAANELLRNNQQSSEDRFRKYTEDYSRWEKEREQYKMTLKDRETRLSALTDEVERLRITFDAHRTELHEKLAETRQETEAVRELQIALEKARFRVEQLEQILDETEDERNKALDEKHELEVLLLQERDSNKATRHGAQPQLLETTQNQINQLRLECEKLHSDAEKDDFEVMELRKSLTNCDAEMKKLQDHVKLLEKKSEELHQFRTAWSAMEKEKRHLEEKVVELQVLVARYQSPKPLTKAEQRVKELKEENDTFKREVDFLNSVIVDMQRKVDDLKLQLELNQSNQLGHILSDLNLNGMKSSVVTPRLFCDICDAFDLHDTEDCPKQATDYTNGDI